MDEKKYILEISNDSISIIDTTSGMKESVPRSAESVFIERVALLMAKDLLEVSEFTPSWERTAAPKRARRKKDEGIELPPPV